VGFDESFEHGRNLVLVGQTVGDDDPGGQALEGGELEWVNFAVGDQPEEVNRTLRGCVAGVDVASVFQKNFDNLENKNKNHILNCFTLLSGTQRR
jgi:hypothetical protein